MIFACSAYLAIGNRQSAIDNQTLHTACELAMPYWELGIGVKRFYSHTIKINSANLQFRWWIVSQYKQSGCKSTRRLARKAYAMTNLWYERFTLVMSSNSTCEGIFLLLSLAESAIYFMTLVSLPCSSNHRGDSGTNLKQYSEPSNLILHCLSVSKVVSKVGLINRDCMWTFLFFYQ